MLEQLLEFITENYRSARKIVEVGVGHRIDVAQRLKEHLPETDVVVTDKDETWPRQHRTRNVKVVIDDATSPHLPLYRHASLIYSLHPPVELVSPLEKLCDEVRSDLLIVPLSDEQGDFDQKGWTKVIRQGRIIALLRHTKGQSQL